MPTFALAAGSGCAAVATPGEGDPWAVPYALLSENQQERARKVMDAPTCMVELERTPVRSRPEVYVFLMDELPFTAGVLRELGESKYEISRDGKGGYLFNDHAGLTLRAELLRRDEGRWVWYTHGAYSLGILGSAVGRSVIVVRTAEVEGVLQTEARVYAKVESKLLESAAKAMRGLVEGVIRDKSFVFIKAARTVAELTARDAGRLYTTVRGSPHVDADVLEEFRKRFVH